MPPKSKNPSLRGRPGSFAKGVARRQEILDRAIGVFANRGADGTSLRKIAEEIGVSHAALLHYFDSREQLLIEVHRHAEERALEESPMRSHGSTLEMLADDAVRNAKVPGLVQLYTTLVASAMEDRNPEARAHFSARFEQVRGIIAEQLRADQAAGLVRQDIDSEELAAILVAISDGLQMQWLLDSTVELPRLLTLMGRLLTP